MRASEFVNRPIPFAEGYLIFSKHFLDDRSVERNISVDDVMRVLRKLERVRSQELIKMPYVTFGVRTHDLSVGISKNVDRFGKTAYVVTTAHPTLALGPDEDVFYLEEELEEDVSRRGFLKGLAGAGAIAGAASLLPRSTPKDQPRIAKAIDTVKKVFTPISPNPELEKNLADFADAAGIKGIELAQFLAQMKHESWDFTRLKEKPKGKKYFSSMYDIMHSPRVAKILGNIHKGDGERFHGRGYIQLTGRANYKRAQDALDIPLLDNPDLAAKPDIAAKIAVWYWNNRVKPFITDFTDTAGVTRKINPALKGLSNREANFEKYAQMF